uniref:hypothetical protein n=1 Tax=Vibrio vulnificus TaxID=672 RepID=UPI00102BC498
TIKDSITSLLMRPTSVGKDTQHELGQPLKKLAYVSNHRGPLLKHCAVTTKIEVEAKMPSVGNPS